MQVSHFGEGGEALVGLPGSAASSRALLPLARLADEWLQVVLYERPAEGCPLTEFEALVAQLELGTVHLLGQAAGAALALECALALPELVESLVLCDVDPEAPGAREMAPRLEEIAVPVLVAHGAQDGAAWGFHRELVQGLGDARWLILGQSEDPILHGPEADVLLPAIRSFILRAAV